VGLTERWQDLRAAVFLAVAEAAAAGATALSGQHSDAAYVLSISSPLSSSH
jgi:hypothetical protein